MLIKRIIFFVFIFFFFGVLKTEATFGVDTSFRQVKSNGSSAVYYLDHARGLKKAYISEKSFLTYGNKWSDIKIVSQEELNKWSDVQLVKSSDSPAVYYISNGKKAKIFSEVDFNTFGFKYENIVTIKKEDLDNYVVADYIQSGLSVAGGINPINRLDVRLDKNTPKSGLVPFRTVDNVIGIFDLKAYGTAINIKSLKIALHGIFNISGIDQIRLADENGNYLEPSGLLTNRSETFSFNNSPLLIKPLEEKKIFVLATLKNYNGSTNHTIQAAIDSESDVVTEAAADVEGVFPVNANTFKLVDASAILGNVTVSEKQIGATSVTIGKTGQTVGIFNVEETSGKEAVILKSAVLSYASTMKNTSFGNFYLKSGEGKIISQAGVFTGNMIKFKINDFKLDKKLSANISVIADALGGEGERVNFNLERLEVKGDSGGYNLLTTIINISEVISIVREKITSTRLDLKAEKYTFKNQTGSILGAFQINSESKKISVTNMNFSLSKGSTAPNLTNPLFLVNYNTGEIYGSVNRDTINSASFNFDFAGIAIDAKKNIKVALINQLPDNVAKGNTYFLTLNSVSYSINNTGYIDNLNLAGKLMTVNLPIVAIIKNTQFTSAKFTKGATGITIASFYIDVSGNDSFVLDKLSFDNANGTSSPITYANGFSVLSLYINGKKLSKNDAPAASGYVFENLNYKISAGNKLEIKLLVNTEANLNADTVKTILIGFEGHSSSANISILNNSVNMVGQTVYFINP